MGSEYGCVSPMGPFCLFMQAVPLVVHGARSSPRAARVQGVKPFTCSQRGVIAPPRGRKVRPLDKSEGVPLQQPTVSATGVPLSEELVSVPSSSRRKGITTSGSVLAV